MSAFLIAVALLLAAGAKAQLTTTGVGGSFGGSSAYVGPGDLSLGTGFRFWGGFRAYSAAKAGTPAAVLKRASDGAQQSVNSLASGAFDAATAATFCASTTCTVVEVYDQSGNLACATACNAIAATALAYSATACNGKPGALFNSATPDSLVIGGYPGKAQPFTTVTVASRTGNTGAYNPVMVSEGSRTGLYFNAGTNAALIYAGSIGAPAAASNNALHAFAGVFDTSSRIVVDGAGSAVSPGAGGLSAGNVTFGTNPFGNWAGALCEFGVIEAASSTGDTAALSGNQRGPNGWNF